MSPMMMHRPPPKRRKHSKFQIARTKSNFDFEEKETRKKRKGKSPPIFPKAFFFFASFHDLFPSNGNHKTDDIIMIGYHKMKIV